MNNNRLSTSGKPTVDRNQLLIDITNMLKGPSNFEVKDGRQIIKSSNKLVGVGQQTIVELLEEKGGIIKTFYSISDCAKHLDVSRTFVYTRLKNGKPFLFEDKRVLVKYGDNNESSDQGRMPAYKILMSSMDPGFYIVCCFWRRLGLFCRCCMAFFVRFGLLLGIIDSSNKPKTNLRSRPS